MNDLVTWLRAQLDARQALAEQAARDTAGGDWYRYERYVMTTDQSTPDDDPHLHLAMDGTSAVLEHAAANDPKMILAGIAAARRILDLCEPSGYRPEDDTAFYVGGYGEAYWDVVRLLALPHAGQSGYRDEWRP
jgi:hypothetical protein